MIQYVLDGQQRMTSLYVAMRGLKINDDDRNDDFSEIYVDLEAKEDEPIVIGDIEGKSAETLVRFTDLLGSTVKVAIAHPDYSDKIEAYSQAVKGYQFSIISVSDAPIEIATEIFTRLNEGGKRLSVFEIMVAKTYDLPSNFDLSEKYEKLVDELAKSSFETISSAVVLQAVSACLVGECAKKHILKLDKFSIIKEWDNIINAFKESVDYMHSFLSYRGSLRDEVKRQIFNDGAYENMVTGLGFASMDKSANIRVAPYRPANLVALSSMKVQDGIASFIVDGFPKASLMKDIAIIGDNGGEALNLASRIGLLRAVMKAGSLSYRGSLRDEVKLK